MTEYVVLIVGDADRWWTTMDAEQRAAGYAEYTRFGEELTPAGPHGHRGRRAALDVRGQAHPGAAGAPSPTARSPRSPSRSAASTRSRPTTSTTCVDCCQIIAALGDTVEVRRTVSPEDRA